MTKLKELKDFVNGQYAATKLFGADEKHWEEFLVKVKRIGETLTNELGMTLEEGSSLGPDTELTLGSNRLFQELKAWVKEAETPKS